MTDTRQPPRRMRFFTAILLVVLIFAFGAPVSAAEEEDGPDPAVYLNFEEGSGAFALDDSGHGNAAALYNVSRIDGGGCGRALSFANFESYAAVPFRSLNHPVKEISVSAWFFIDNITPVSLVSGYYDGGYRLGFDDGNDLWWTVNLDGTGDVSVPLRHEMITPGQWHQVTGTYDGKTSKIYLDGVLRNQADATGDIRYEQNNYIILGADAGAGDAPGECPHYFSGGLDDVRIYPVALTYSQVMDDRYQCPEGPRVPLVVIPAETSPGACEPVSGSISLGINESAARILSFADKTVNGTWQVSMQPGSLLRVQAYDAYMKTYPDSWYLEIAENGDRPARTIAFPNTNNAPAEAVLPSGNGTVTVRYFSGGERFPAKVLIRLESIPPVHAPRPVVPRNILENPIIVIYSASWATLVAILLVMIWLHRRKKAKQADVPKETGEQKSPCGEEKKL